MNCKYMYSKNILPMPYVCGSAFFLRSNLFITCLDKCPWQPSANIVHLACSSIPLSKLSLGLPSLAIPTSLVATPLINNKKILFYFLISQNRKLFYIIASCTIFRYQKNLVFSTNFHGLKPPESKNTIFLLISKMCHLVCTFSEKKFSKRRN